MPSPSRGVLHPVVAATRFDLRSFTPAPALAPFVEYHWMVRWDLRGRAAHEQQVLTHPNVHLVFEEPEVRLYGVHRSLFVRRLEGTGHVLGVRFRAGGFRPFLDGPVADLTDRAVPAEELFGKAVSETSRTVLSASDGPAMAAAADAFLLDVAPEPDPTAEEVAAMVTRITAAPQIVRVGQAAVELDVPVRRLQRLFAEYVGVSPKWVLRRARLHEAAARADRGEPTDWAGLAADLGYADQAHFVRDFTSAVGMPPARYAKVVGPS
jgi:AraC-like DNA-binding protein